MSASELTEGQLSATSKLSFFNQSECCLPSHRKHGQISKIHLKTRGLLSDWGQHPREQPEHRLCMGTGCYFFFATSISSSFFVTNIGVHLSV